MHWWRDATVPFNNARLPCCSIRKVFKAFLVDKTSSVRLVSESEGYRFSSPFCPEQSTHTLVALTFRRIFLKRPAVVEICLRLVAWTERPWKEVCHRFPVTGKSRRPRRKEAVGLVKSLSTFRLVFFILGEEEANSPRSSGLRQYAWGKWRW